MNSQSSAQGSATVSDPISSETIVNVQNKRQLKSYKCILEYSDVKSATERLKEEICESNYIFRYTRPNTDGFKDYYHCQNNQKCPKVLYLLRHNDSLRSSIWISESPHVHCIKPGGSLPVKSVAHIKKLFDEKTRYTNNELIKSLKRNNCPQLTTTQLNNLKQRLKEKRIGKSNCCIHEIKEWCERKLVIPVDEDEIFCGAFSYSEDENLEIIHLRVFITTKRLISVIKISHKTYADGNKFIDVCLILED